MDSAVTSSRQVNKVKIIDIVSYILLFVGARYFSSPSISGILLLLSLTIIIFSNIETTFACLMFQMLINDNLTVFSVVSYSILVDAIFVIKCVFQFRVIKKKNDMYMLLIVFLGQMVSALLYDTQLKDIISLFLCLSIYIFVSENYKKVVSADAIVPICICSVASGCLLSIMNDKREYDWQRFSGIWNDENFCGFYCIIGLLFCAIFLFSKNKSIFKRLISISCILLFVYTATLTLSRSFIYGVTLLALIGMGMIFFDRRIKPIYKLLILILGITAMYFIVTKSFSIIIDQRGLTSTTGDDWTNNRFLYSENALNAYSKSPIAWISGVGINNIPRFVEKFGFIGRATHNTYVDFIIQFGAVQGVLGIFYIIRTALKLKNVEAKKFEKWIAIVILFYMAVLTMTQYEFLYLFLGLMEGCVIDSYEKSINVLSD